MPTLIDIMNNSVYGAQALVALWALFCAILVWRRSGALNFRTAERQDAFLDEITPLLHGHKFDEVVQTCEDDPRALPQLTLLALEHRRLEPTPLLQTIAEHFQRDGLAVMDFRMSWVSFAIKTEPMLGLLGTVMGMVGAFANMGTGEKVDATKLATDISFALYTTAIGLAVAVPLMLISAIINVRIRKLEDRVSAGITRLVETMKPVVGARAAEPRKA